MYCIVLCDIYTSRIIINYSHTSLLTHDLTTKMMKNVGVPNKGFEADIELRENIKTENEENENQIDDCGFCFNLQALNKLRSPKWFLFFLSLGAFFQGFCVNGLINVAITSIERRFGLKSAHSGLIASSYDIGSMIAMIPVSYYGGDYLTILS